MSSDDISCISKAPTIKTSNKSTAVVPVSVPHQQQQVVTVRSVDRRSDVCNLDVPRKNNMTSNDNKYLSPPCCSKMSNDAMLCYIFVRMH